MRRLQSAVRPTRVHIHMHVPSAMCPSASSSLNPPQHIAHTQQTALEIHYMIRQRKLACAAAQDSARTRRSPACRRCSTGPRHSTVDGKREDLRKVLPDAHAYFAFSFFSFFVSGFSFLGGLATLSCFCRQGSARQGQRWAVCARAPRVPCRVRHHPRSCILRGGY